MLTKWSQWSGGTHHDKALHEHHITNFTTSLCLCCYMRHARSIWTLCLSVLYLLTCLRSVLIYWNVKILQHQWITHTHCLQTLPAGTVGLATGIQHTGESCNRTWMNHVYGTGAFILLTMVHKSCINCTPSYQQRFTKAFSCIQRERERDYNAFASQQVWSHLPVNLVIYSGNQDNLE